MANPESPPHRKPRFRERHAAKEVVEAPEAVAKPTTVKPTAHAATATRLPEPSRVTTQGLRSSLPSITIEQALFGLLLIIGFVLRFWDVGSKAMHGDEAEHAWFAWHLYNGTGYQYDPVYHGPLQFIVTAFFYFLFGVSDTTARLMAVLFGTALIALPYFLRNYMGRTAALVAAAFITTSPAFIYVSRLERDDIFTCFFAFTLVIAIFSFIRTGLVRYVYLAAVSIALSLAAMENTYITLFVFGSYVLVVLEKELSLIRSAGTLLISLLSFRRTGFFRYVYLAVVLIVFILLAMKSRYAALLAFGLYVLVVIATEISHLRSAGKFLRSLWIRTGIPKLLSDHFFGIFGLVLVAAFAITVSTGWYFPVPLVLGIFLVMLVHRQTVLELPPVSQRTMASRLRSISWQRWLNALTISVAILILAYSTFGTNLRGIWDSTQPLLNTPQGCDGNHYFLNPCRKDIIGGLFYWLSQHGIHRGGQPWFYYTLLFGLYEQIAVILGVGGILWFMRRPTIFTTFLVYWAVLMFGIYSWAGEKFPWLMIHPLLPFTLLAAMFVAEVFRRGRLIKWVAASVLAALLLVQLHNVYEVNFVNAADPIEPMVYVQSSPASARVAHDILVLSNKVTNGNDLNVTIDSSSAWPFAWYLRDMPNVAYPSCPDTSTTCSILQTKPYVNNPVIIVSDIHQPALYPLLRKDYIGHHYYLRWWYDEGYKSLTWRSFWQDLTDPGYLGAIGQWLVYRHQLSPKAGISFYYYVKKGLASPY